MPDNEQSLRTSTINALVKELRNAPKLVGVACSPCWPGAGLKLEHIWVGSPDGDLSFPGMMNDDGSITLQDDFEFEVMIGVSTEGLPAEKVGPRCEQLMTAVLRVFVDNMARFTEAGRGVPGLHELKPTSAEGPHVVPEEHGYGAIAIIGFEAWGRIY